MYWFTMIVFSLAHLNVEVYIAYWWSAKCVKSSETHCIYWNIWWLPPDSYIWVHHYPCSQMLKVLNIESNKHLNTLRCSDRFTSPFLIQLAAVYPLNILQAPQVPKWTEFTTFSEGRVVILRSGFWSLIYEPLVVVLFFQQRIEQHGNLVPHGERPSDPRLFPDPAGQQQPEHHQHHHSLHPHPCCSNAQVGLATSDGLYWYIQGSASMCAPLNMFHHLFLLSIPKRVWGGDYTMWFVKPFLRLLLWIKVIYFRWTCWRL